MQINITKTVYKVSDFLSWQRADSLSLSPSFQRRSVWPIAAKSFLIDTVVRGLPMPIIILREQTNLDTLELGRLNWRPIFDRILDLVAHHRCLGG